MFCTLKLWDLRVFLTVFDKNLMFLILSLKKTLCIIYSSDSEYFSRKEENDLARAEIKKSLSEFFRSRVLPFIIVIVLMLMQLISLFIASNWQKFDVYDNQANNEIDRCITDIDNIVESVKEVLFNLKLDNEIMGAMSKPKLTPIEEQRLFLKLNSCKKYAKDLKNIYIYKCSENTIYSTAIPQRGLNEFPFGKTREMLQNGWKGQKIVVVTDKADFMTSIYGGERVFRLMMKFDKASNDVLMADIGFDTVREAFRSYEKSLGGETYICSADGEVVYGGVDLEEPPADLLKVGLEENRAIRSYYGKDYLVIHKKISQMEMDVFGVIPEDNMNADNFRTRTFLMINLVTISIVVLLGFILILFKSLKNTAKKHAQEIEDIKQNDIRETFLKKRQPIIDCFRHTDPEEIQKCKELIAEIFGECEDKKIALARVDLCNMSGEKLMIRKKYDLISKIEEIFKRNISAYAVYEQDDYVVVLIGEPGFDHVARCRKAYQECCDVLSEFSIVPACYVSGAVDAEEIREIYIEVTNLAEYMFIYNRPMFLDFTLLLQRAEKSDSWIETGISGIKNNIITPSEDAATQLDNFINGLRELSVKDAKQAIYSLYFAIGQCVDQIRSEDMSFSFDMLRYFPRLSSLKTLDEARVLFVEMVNELQKQHTESESDKYGVIVKRSLDIIEERLGDPALCRSMIADEIGISKPYLGRIFKDLVGISLSDAINDMRLKAVAEQLVTTNKSIKDLISDVGIVNQSYFTVMFKKKYGLSPSEYRNKKSNLSHGN